MNAICSSRALFNFLRYNVIWPDYWAQSILLSFFTSFPCSILLVTQNKEKTVMNHMLSTRSGQNIKDIQLSTFLSSGCSMFLFVIFGINISNIPPKNAKKKKLLTWSSFFHSNVPIVWCNVSIFSKSYTNISFYVNISSCQSINLEKWAFEPDILLIRLRDRALKYIKERPN